MYGIIIHDRKFQVIKHDNSGMYDYLTIGGRLKIGKYDPPKDQEFAQLVYDVAVYESMFQRTMLVVQYLLSLGRYTIQAANRGINGTTWRITIDINPKLVEPQTGAH